MNQSANPTSIAGAIWRHRLLAVTVFAIVIAGVVWWLRTAPREYTASATMTATPVTSLLESTGNIENLQATLAEVANSQSVLQDVSARLGGRRTVTVLRNEVHGAQVTGTSLIRVTVTDRDARTASDIANSVAAVLPTHDPSRGLLQFTQVDPARPPATYASPNTKVVSLAGAGLGLLLAFGAALLYDALAGRVEDVDQVRASTGSEVLATVRRPRRTSSLPAAQEGAASTAFRSLRTAIRLAEKEKPFGAIVITSPSAKRDVSPWLATNVAVAIARTRQQVLLIDAADSLEYPGLEGSLGLFDILRDDTKMDDALVEGPVDGVTVLPTGRRTGVGQLETRFQKVLVEAASRFDAVVVVAAPLSESDDAKAMAVGGLAVLAIASRTVRSELLRDLAWELESAHVRVLGTVLVK